MHLSVRLLLHMVGWTLSGNGKASSCSHSSWSIGRCTAVTPLTTSYHRSHLLYFQTIGTLLDPQWRPLTRMGHTPGARRSHFAMMKIKWYLFIIIITTIIPFNQYSPPRWCHYRYLDKKDGRQRHFDLGSFETFGGCWFHDLSPLHLPLESLRTCLALCLIHHFCP